MRKIKQAISLTLLSLLVSSCGGNGAISSTGNSSSSSSKISSSSSLTSSSSSSSSQGEIGEITQMPDKAVIHYKNVEENYTGLTFWLWSDSSIREEETASLGTDEFGMYTEVSVSKYIKKDSDISFSFLVKSEGTWAFQTSDVEVYIGNFITEKVNDEYVMHVYALAITKNDIELYRTVEEASKDYLKSARFSLDGKSISLEGSSEIDNYKLYAYDASYYKNQQTVNEEDYLVFSASNVKSDIVKAQLDINFELDFNKVYRVVATFTNDLTYSFKKTIDLSNLYDTDLFKDKKYGGDDLGLSFDEYDTPIFKVFAPTAALVQVNLYPYGYTSKYATDATFEFQRDWYNKPRYTFDLLPQANGLFTSEGITEGNWANENIRKEVRDGDFYYTYTSYTSKGVHEVVDPYARSTSIDSLRAYIFKMDDEKATPDSWKALPKKWDGDPVYDIESAADLVVSENHIRDLTMDKTWTQDEEVRKLAGTFQGFAKEGTTYTRFGTTVKTGFDHLEEYGVNAIQLLPIFDQDNDEVKKEYNWGYNPLNYNVLEGSYSSDPMDPLKRIYEFRELVAKYANNANHARIIMDVVYNHVSKANTSNFEYLAPGYYFRLDENGSFLDGSGCGNEFKSEAPMARKFIVDSVSFWAQEYLIKGFRFDLMGLIDTETMKQVKEALYKIDPDIVVYGEGWDATGAYYNDPTHATTNSVYSQLYESESSLGYVGAFNDAGRNAIRGENNGGNNYPGYGFISQGANDLSRDKVNAIADMFKGNHTGSGGNPLQTVNYASCHDNYTLFDQLYWTLSEDGGVTEPDIIDVAKASIAVNGMILMSNGISFINGGEEIFRSKEEDNADSLYAVNMYGKLISHNSYKSSDNTNSYKYDRKVDLLEYFNMYKDLVALRKNLKFIPYPTNNNDPDSINTWNTDSGTTVAGYRLGKDGTCYYILLNGRNDSSTFSLGEGTQIFTNGATFTRTPSGISVSGKYALGVYKY